MGEGIPEMWLTHPSLGLSESTVLLKDRSCFYFMRTGNIELSNSWANSLLIEMQMVKGKWTTNSHENRNIQDPGRLILNWNQTGLNIVPVAGWTMANVESKREEINELTTSVKSQMRIFSSTLCIYGLSRCIFGLLNAYR